jgi:SAM-dependent methyltransferase
MPSVEQNGEMWEHTYAWPDGGDEWSGAWGTPAAQWTGSILPAVSRAAPWFGEADPTTPRTIVEIGCGHGRWTQHLLARPSTTVIGVDLAPSCVEACRARFLDRPARFVVCDGASLPTVADGSVDLAFSYDSLVHADQQAVSGYLGELARVLAPEGVAVLHHSNLGERRLERVGIVRRWGPLRRTFVRLGLLEGATHWRDPSVDVDAVVRAAAAAGLSCIRQERFRWGTARTPIDALSVIVRAGSAADGPLERTTVDVAPPPPA